MSIDLIPKIATFCAARGYSITLFCRVALNDPGFVVQVRRGRRPGAAVIKKIEDILAGSVPDPCAKVVKQERTARAVGSRLKAEETRKSRIEREETPFDGSLPRCPAVPNLDGVFLGRGEVIIMAAGTRIYLSPDDARMMAARLVAAAEAVG